MTQRLGDIPSQSQWWKLGVMQTYCSLLISTWACRAANEELGAEDVEQPQPAPQPNGAELSRRIGEC